MNLFKNFSTDLNSASFVKKLTAFFDDFFALFGTLWLNAAKMGTKGKTPIKMCFRFKFGIHYCTLVPVCRTLDTCTDRTYIKSQGSIGSVGGGGGGVRGAW